MLLQCRKSSLQIDVKTQFWSFIYSYFGERIMFSNIINALSVWFLLTYPWNGNTSKWDMNIIKLPFLVFVTVDLDWDTEPFSTDTYTNIYIQEIHMLHQIHGLHTLDGTLCSGALSVCVSVIASACCFFFWGGGVGLLFFFFFSFCIVCVCERERARLLHQGTSPGARRLGSRQPTSLSESR